MKKVVILISIVSLAGCAHTSMPYSRHKSLALNVVHAGGVRDIEDRKLSAEEHQQVSGSNPIYGAASSGMNYVNPAPGFANSAALGIGVLGMLFPPEADSKISVLMAWMPHDISPDIKASPFVLSNIVKKATETALNELKFEITYSDTENLDPGFKATFSSNLHSGNEAIVNNTVSFETHIPNNNQGELFYKGGETRPVYAFGHWGSDRVTRLLVTTHNNSEIPESVIYSTISKNLPNWVYLYIAPNTVHDEKSNVIPYPFVLSKGKVELFIRPKN